MTITYRTAGAWGAGKGSNLMPEEIDGTIWQLVQDIGAMATTGNGIDNVIQTGTQVTFVMTNADEYTINLPRPVQRPTTTLAVSAPTLTPSLSQVSYYFRCTAAGGCAVTIPTNAAVAFPVDIELHFCQRGAGAITFSAAPGVTLNIPDGFESYTGGVGAVVTAKKVGTNEWDIFGLLAESA